jgi:fatty-acyl-CoA synthase
MRGTMQDWPLTMGRVIDHAAKLHGGREIVSRSVEGPIRRTTYAEVRRNALKLAKRLAQLGVKPGDRIGTLAWNTWRHLEAWYGITGAGAVYHTLNPRLFSEQIAWIADHGGDRMILTDLTFVKLLEGVQDKLPQVERFVVLCAAADLPETSLRGAVAYETLLAEADEDFRWVEVDENDAAGMCYTSGTTGNPKGVVYSHRSNVLHAMQVIQPDMLGFRARDRVMPVVPFFHANGWSIALSAPMAGATLVLPGPKMDGPSIYELLTAERVTFSAAVPTVWLALLQHLETDPSLGLPDLDRVVIGGSACPRAVTERFRDRYGVEVLHAWGMTEMSPLGTVCSLKPEVEGATGEAWLDVKQKVGHPPFGVEMRIVDDHGHELPWDDVAYGRLQVRGPAVTAGYFRGEGGAVLDPDGWFDTGDVAAIDPHGYTRIVDRNKDVIKSGGEWISSIDLENLAVGHPDVAEAAVIGIAHPKWDERPLLVVVPKPGRRPDKAGLLAHMEGRVAKWWLPDDVVVVDDIPHTATGKIQKTALRERFRDYRLPTA